MQDNAEILLLIGSVDLMVGCMLGSSRAIAPALLLAPLATYVDLDAPLLLEEDVAERLEYRDSNIMPSSVLWGCGDAQHQQALEYSCHFHPPVRLSE